MAKRMWYHNVPAEVLNRGPAPGSASYERQAKYRAYVATQDNPAMAGALLKSNIPAPMLDRIAAERTRRNAVQAAPFLAAQGIQPPGAMSEAARSALALRGQLGQEAANQPEGFWSKVDKALGGIPHGLLTLGKEGLSGAVNILELLGNVIEEPIAAGLANNTEPNPVAEWTQKHPGVNIAFPLVAGAATVGAGASAWLSGAQHLLHFGWEQGPDGSWHRIGLSAGQQADMRRNGFNPDSLVDRFQWYYHDWTGNGFRAVSDRQMQRVIDAGATPDEASALREFVTSGAANDPSGANLSSLSPFTQQIASSITAGDPRLNHFLRVVDDDNSLQFGGTFADALGLRDPSPMRSVSTAVADLIGTWYVDPLAVAGEASRVSRAAMWGIQADRFGDVARVMAASNEAGRPLHATGQVMNQMLTNVDDVFLLTRRGEEAQSAGKFQDAARDIGSAAQITERFRRLHPDLGRQWDAMMQLRSGAVQKFVPRDTEQMTREISRANERGRESFPLEAVTDSSGRPAWSLRSSLDESLSDADKLTSLAKTRAKLAEDMELLIIQEAMSTGRPLVRNRIVLPGRVTMGARARQTLTPIVDALARHDTKLARVLEKESAKPGAVDVGELAGGAHEADLASGHWTTTLTRRDRSLSGVMGRMQSFWDSSPAGRVLSFYGSQGTETLRRLVLQSGMPRRQAYALINKWSLGSPAERWSLWRELATSMVETGGLRDSAAKRAAVEFYTKGVVTHDSGRRLDEQLTAQTHERYASGDHNTINVEGREMAAGILPMHMADGIIIPSMRDLKLLTGRVSLVNRVLGLGKRNFTDQRFEDLRTGTRVWKSNVTATFSNFQRQLGEGVAFLQAIDPAVLGRAAKARHSQALDTAEKRLTVNRAITGARVLRDTLMPHDIAELEWMQREDPARYRQELFDYAIDDGVKPAVARALSLVSENTDLAHLQGMKKSGLFLAGPLDVLRRARLAANEKLGTRDVGKNIASWHQHIDREMLGNIIDSHLANLNTMTTANRVVDSGNAITAADTTIGGMVRDAGNAVKSRIRRAEDEITQAAANGAKLRRPNLRPNAWKEVPTTDNAGLTALADEISRWQDDEIGRDVLRRLAFDLHVAPRMKKNVEGRLFTQYQKEALDSPEVTRLVDERRQTRMLLAAAQRRKVRDAAREDELRTKIRDTQKAINDTRKRVAQTRLRQTPTDFDPGATFSRMRAKELAGNDPRIIKLRTRMAEIEHSPDFSETKLTPEFLDKWRQTRPELDEYWTLNEQVNELTKQLTNTGHYWGDTVQEMTDDLLARNERMQQYSARLHHDTDGRPIGADDEAGLAAARERLSHVIVDEARNLLGIKRSVIPGFLGGDPEEVDAVHDTVRPVLERIWDRKIIRAEDLKNIPDTIRPPMARRPEYIPALDGGDKNKLRAAINRLAALQYDTFVGKPLQRLWTSPLFQAEMHVAYNILDPVADALIGRGLSPQTTALFLEQTAAQYATRAVFYTTDDPSEHSAFVELADNHLMFVRATENFFRRLGDVVSINPARVARSWLFAESAVTSGAVYQVPGFSSEDEHEWFFTYPGSALAARVVDDLTRSMGWGDTNVKVPVFSGLNAPVKFLNPTLNNPIGTSANPVFALPLRAIRDYLLPTAWAPSVNENITAVEGGEEGFATKSTLRSLMPTWASRVFDALDWEEGNSKLMSSFYSAMITAEAAGIIPGEEASPDQREDATHSIRQLAINNLVLRMLGGLFLPGSPWNEDMRTADTPPVDAIAMRNGVHSIRNEWFSLLESYTKQFGPDQGLGRAHAEWARRYPLGRGIVNPEAYTAGTYQTVNPDPDVDVTKSIPRTDEMVDFFVRNRALYEKYGPLVPLLVPAIGDRYFDTEANQQLFVMGVIEKKGMERFARDVRTAQNITDYYRKRDEKDAALASARSDSEKERINQDWYDFQARWEIAYPASARKRDAGSDPDYVHDTMSSTVAAFLKDDSLPPEMAAMKPAVQELYDDYTAYRTKFMATKPWDREDVNKAYWNVGDKKWPGTPMEPLWKAFRVYEGRN